MSQGTTTPFQLAQIYLTRAAFSYRMPNPLAVPADTKVKPQQVQISAAVEHFEADRPGLPPATQVRIRVASNPEDGDPNALYDFEVEWAGFVYDVDKAMPEPVLVQNVAWILYPFLRETVANLTMRARFGVAWLRPLDLRTFVPVSEEAGGEMGEQPADK